MPAYRGESTGHILCTDVRIGISQPPSNATRMLFAMFVKTLAGVLRVCIYLFHMSSFIQLEAIVVAILFLGKGNGIWVGYDMHTICRSFLLELLTSASNIITLESWPCGLNCWD